MRLICCTSDRLDGNCGLLDSLLLEAVSARTCWSGRARVDFALAAVPEVLWSLALEALFWGELTEIVELEV